MIRALIVSPYAALRAGLHALLAEAAECEVIGEVSGSADLDLLLTDARPDALVLDSHREEVEAVLELAAAAGTPVVLLAEDPADWLLMSTLALPGWGYLLKDADGEAIAAALRAAAAGLVALGPGVALTPGGSRRGNDPPVGERLTPREREVLQLLAEGLPNKSIAARLGISQNTVKFHVASLLAKLGAASRTEAVAIGIRQGDVTQ